MRDSYLENFKYEIGECFTDSLSAIACVMPAFAAFVAEQAIQGSGTGAVVALIGGAATTPAISALSETLPYNRLTDSVSGLRYAALTVFACIGLGLSVGALTAAQPPSAQTPVPAKLAK